jgi:hypothetical protein
MDVDEAQALGLAAEGGHLVPLSRFDYLDKTLPRQLARNKAVRTEVAHALLTAGMPAARRSAAVVVIDGTASATWPRPLSRRTRREMADDSAALARSRRAVEARWQKRTPTFSHPKPIFGGFMLIPVVGTHKGKGQVHLVLDVTLTAGNVPEAGERILTAHLARRRDKPVAVMDKQFSHRLRLLNRLRQLGIRTVFDLYENQRVPKEPTKHRSRLPGQPAGRETSGAVNLHGWPYDIATPEGYYDPGPVPKSGTPAYKTWEQRYDNLHIYACRRNAYSPWWWKSHFVSPCRKPGGTACILVPASLRPGRRRIHHPPSRFARPLMCKHATFSATSDSYEGTYQYWEWGSRTWRAYYFLGRAAVEGVFGEFRSPFEFGWERGSLTASGREGKVFLCCLLLCLAYNIKTLMAAGELEVPVSPQVTLTFRTFAPSTSGE